MHLEERQQRPAADRLSSHRVISAGRIIWRCIICRCVDARSCLKPGEQRIECCQPGGELE